MIPEPEAMQTADVSGAAREPRNLIGLVLATASAPAAMVAVGWHGLVRRGGELSGGDMAVHAATAEWLRTLPWWDWRGWSDWFYGGQAVGVNYPPLGHAWIRFTDPFHGQMAAVAVGLLVLLPWGALRLARSVGLDRRAQEVAVASVIVVTAASGGMHWVLSGFHIHYTFFGSWPAMLAVVCGLFAAAWAARCQGAAWCGVVVGVSALLNASYLPATVLVCAVLVATSGASARQVLRWAVTAAAASLAVCGWWLVPFVAGWSRLLTPSFSLEQVWRYGGLPQEVLLATVGVAAVCGAVRSEAARRLAMASGAGIVVAVAADLVGYQRAERFLGLSILVAGCAAAGLLLQRPAARGPVGVRPVWAVTAAAVVAFVGLRLDQHEILPLAGWILLWRPGRSWVVGGALAWFVVLLWVPVWHQLRNPPSPEPQPGTVMEGIAALSGSDARGLVYLGDCQWTNAWRTTVATGGRIRVADGLYRETSASAEFLVAPTRLDEGTRGEAGRWASHWHDALSATGAERLDGSASAYAVGARWHAECDDDENFTMHELPAVAAEGTRIVAYPDGDSWHRAAVDWWIALASSDFRDAPPELWRVPVLWPAAAAEGDAARVDQAARGVSLRTEQDRLLVTAESAGWAWVRVPWDPWWFADDGVPLKGGPAHLVVWVEPGVTELRWDVPAQVDAMAAGITALSLLLLAVMVRVNRREGWDIDPDRPRPAADALDRFADAADRRLVVAGRAVRSAGPRRTSTEPATDDHQISDVETGNQP